MYIIQLYNTLLYVYYIVINKYSHKPMEGIHSGAGVRPTRAPRAGLASRPPFRGARASRPGPASRAPRATAHRIASRAHVSLVTAAACRRIAQLLAAAAGPLS